MTPHDEQDCPDCAECPGCNGGSGAWPVNYKLVPFPGGKYASVRCADCDGQGLTCDCNCHEQAEESA